MGEDHHSSEYTDDILIRAQRLWGEGFLSPGGPSEVTRLVEGIELEGRTVLDIGCGLGGVDLLLVREHGAGRVTALDIEPKLIELAKASAADAGLTDRIDYRLVKPGPLGFDGESFDVVFSQNAIIHIEDTAGLFADAYDVLRPGGRLVLSDWMRGSNPDGSASTRLWDLQGLTVNPDTVEARVEVLTAASFVDITTRDRTDHVVEILRGDYDRLAGPLRAEMIGLVGEQRYRCGLESREVMHAAMATRALSAVHMWARKPD